MLHWEGRLLLVFRCREWDGGESACVLCASVCEDDVGVLHIMAQRL